MPISRSTQDWKDLVGIGSYFSVKNFHKSGRAKIYIQKISITGVEDYVAGGFSVHDDKYGMRTITACGVLNINATYGTEYDPVTDKLKLFVGDNIGTEKTAGETISGLKVTLLVIGY